MFIARKFRNRTVYTKQKFNSLILSW